MYGTYNGRYFPWGDPRERSVNKASSANVTDDGGGGGRHDS